MARPKSAEPVLTNRAFVCTEREAEMIEAAARRYRMETGEPCTRSSFLRALVVSALSAPSIN